MSLNRFNLVTPFSMYVVGQSNSGKTVWILKLIDEIDNLCDTKIDKIIFCYSFDQNQYCTLKNDSRVMFNKGPLTLEEIKEIDGKKMIIFDDLCDNIKQSELFEIFSKGVHHSSINFLFVTQNAFMNNRSNRVNCTYLTLMRNPADKLQVMNLSKQMFPENSRYLIDSFNDATARPYGYLVIDNSATTHPDMRLVSNIFKDEGPTVVYVPRKT